MLYKFQSTTAFHYFSLVLTLHLIPFPHSHQNPDDLPTDTVVTPISTMAQAAAIRTRVSVGQYQAYINITPMNVEPFVRCQIGFLIQVHSTFNTTWGNPAIMVLANTAINKDEFLIRYFDKLNILSPPLNLTSPTKLMARQFREGWNTRDKFVQIWKKANMT